MMRKMRMMRIMMMMMMMMVMMIMMMMMMRLLLLLLLVAMMRTMYFGSCCLSKKDGNHDQTPEVIYCLPNPGAPFRATAQVS